ncbi:MAG TPA: hypothetical protein VMV16_05385 [Solirubrobacteraceae bacterium]|nr:hypothetical protein [Solirubrobacteraceae bacterium]
MITSPVEIENGPPHDEEALFREARRLRRRRWTIGLLITAIVLGGTAAIVAVVTSVGGANTTAMSAGTAGVLPNGPVAMLHVAGPLAVAPDGALYVTDVIGSGFEPGGDRVLVRLPDGRFRAIAGDSKVGFPGDGGPAVRAELSSVSDLVFAPDGTLYIADGGRVRTTSRDGVIRAIVGNGEPLRTIANGTPALSAALGSGNPNPLQIALSPARQLYVATGRSQILRMTAAGKLDTVRAVVTSGPWKGPVGGWYPIAVDAHGNIDVGGGPSGWSIWQVAPNGVAHYVGYGRGSGGSDPILQPGPEGAIYAAASGLIRIEPHKLVPISSFNMPLSTVNERPGRYFPLTYFAFSPNGTLYADDIPGNIGDELHQQLVSVHNSRISRLWQEKNATPK